MFRITRKRFAIFVVGLSSSWLGCKPSSNQDVQPPTIFDVPVADSAEAKPLPSKNFSFEAGQEPWISETELPWRAGYLQFLGSQRVGFFEIEISPAAFNKEGIKIVRRDVMQFANAGDTRQATVRLEANEGRDGTLRNFVYENRIGDYEKTVQGEKISSQRLKLSIGLSEENSQKNITYPEGTWGTLGVQAILKRVPLKEREFRKAAVFLPNVDEVAQVEMQAGKLEPTTLMGGQTPELLPIEVRMTTTAGLARTRYWANEKGDIEKTLMLTGPSIVTFRVPFETTQRVQAEMQFAGWQATTVELAGAKQLERATTSTVFQVKANGLDPYKLFPATRIQQPRSVGPRLVDVAVDIGAPGETAAEDQPQAADSQASAAVPAQDTVIEELAEQICGEESEPASLAAKLNAELHQRVTAAETSSGFTTVLQSAAKMEGDVVARNALFIALLRNRGIPARLACGMRARGDSPAVIFHAWTEAWIDQVWVGLDPSTGKPLAPNCLQMGVSSLLEASPYLAVMPVLESMQQLDRVTVISSE